MLNQKQLKFVLPLVFLIIAIFIVMGLMASKSEPDKKPLAAKPILVTYQTVSAQDLQFKIPSQGVVSPLQKTQLTAQVSGKVVSLADVFIEGGFFEKGDVLVSLEASDYQTQVKSAQAELARAKAALKEETARGEVAKQEWQQMADKATDLALRIPQLETERANVVFAQAQLEQAKRNLERTLIRAPYDGIVVTRNAQLGQFLSAGSSVGLIYATQVAEVRLPVSMEDSTYLANLRPKQVKNAPAKVNIKVKIGSNNYRWQAQLTRSEGIVDSDSRMLYFAAQIQDPYNLKNTHEQALHFGQFVEADIFGKQMTQIFKVERNLLTVEQKLMVLDDNMKLNLVKPHIVRSEHGFVYIDKGLTNQAKLITSPVSNPVNGMAVRVASDENEAI
ncbi:efflux RND transporter periplasmic adaptor subunit [Catenovulum adriaticum]|uniref:Efflux RND transporter periplasmic adaptor subunit n=1 Tax=Catenovulum adriaticum TaxID=2984846 RepID=A0ABY7AK31_9ALTE|nr:efflux RND transporter periplasmic adaptor subunit [Catenovulum sp. TS8]WAJ69617.1 efflux RND transporter periplasmic adaptor subunit [Catenovulum sp. TS8]